MGAKAIMVFIWWCATTISITQAIYLDLPNSGTKCVLEEIHSNVLVLLFYVLVNSHDGVRLKPGVTISVEVTSPWGDTLHHKEKITEGEFAFTSIQSGHHSACFWVQGNNSIDNPLTVSLEWQIGIAAKDWESVAKKEKIQGVELELRKLEDSVKAIHENYIFLKDMEAKIRVVSEKTNAKVARFSIMSLGLCIGSSGLQVWYLKRFFSKMKLI